MTALPKIKRAELAGKSVAELRERLHARSIAVSQAKPEGLVHQDIHDEPGIVAITAELQASLERDYLANGADRAKEQAERDATATAIAIIGQGLRRGTKIIRDIAKGNFTDSLPGLELLPGEVTPLIRHKNEATGVAEYTHLGRSAVQEDAAEALVELKPAADDLDEVVSGLTTIVNLSLPEGTKWGDPAFAAEYEAKIKKRYPATDSGQDD